MHRFTSVEHLQAHLMHWMHWMHWMREVVDVRVHGTTAEPSARRFERDERLTLTLLGARASFLQVRELVRRVHSDACIELDSEAIAVPLRLPTSDTAQLVRAALHGLTAIYREGFNLAKAGVDLLKLKPANV